MNTGYRTSLFARLGCAAAAAALFLIPTASQAQFDNTITGLYAFEGNTTGSYNVADGYAALAANTTGFYNTANGWAALNANTTASYNTATGFASLYLNTTGWNNTANGYESLCYNTTGYQNTANGVQALLSNSYGYDNTANGMQALYSNTGGYDNTANGVSALYSNTTGEGNTADGAAALYSNTTGIDNVAAGVDALYANTVGYNNTAIGFVSLINSMGNYNIALGCGAGYNITTGSYNIAIGNQGTAADNGVIRIGTSGNQKATYIAGISGVTASGGVEVFVNANGQLGTIKSSRRFKNDIKDMGSVSDKLMKLRPVTFRYKDSAEKGPHALQYGLIAEEVAKVYPDLVQYDKAGKPFTVYYHLLTPLLLNEFQKEHRQNEAQKAEIMAMKAAHGAEMTALKSELASLKQAQQQQLKVLAKLAAAVSTSQHNAPLQNAAFIQH